MDKQGRVPLVFLFGNADRLETPSIIRLMLSIHKDLVNCYAGDSVPLHALSDRARHIASPEGRYNCQLVVEIYLNAEPVPTPALFSAIQTLPDWLLEEALNLDGLQSLLNVKISQPFPTAVFMLDFVFLTMIVISFSNRVQEALKVRFDSDVGNEALGAAKMAQLYVGVFYFAMRELIQFVGVSSLGAISVYFSDSTNLLDLTFMSLVTYHAFVMQTGLGDSETFRTTAVLTTGLIWTNVMLYLKNLILELAVFVGGVAYVFERLYAFLLATTVILVAFAQMWTTVYQQTDYCLTAMTVSDKDLNDIRCQIDEERYFCDGWGNFLRNINVMLGGLDEQDYGDSNIAMVFFVIFFFMVVIMLANVLIAIVTEAYAVVKNERASAVFWTNRLDFVAEMDAIQHGPLTRFFLKYLRLKQEDYDEEEHFGARQATFGSETWTKLLDLFEQEKQDEFAMWYDKYFSYEDWKLLFKRLAVAFIVLPLWIFLGIFTLGIIWPPQVREYVLVKAIAEALDARGDDTDDRRNLEVMNIQNAVDVMHNELKEEIMIDRTQFVEVKRHFQVLKDDLRGEIREIKKLLTNIFEEGAKNDGDRIR